MIIPDFSKLKGPQFTEKHFKFHYPEFLEFVNSKYPHLNNFQERLYWYTNDLKELPVCEICGSPVIFEGFGKGYRKYCSRKCLNSDPNKKEKTKQTCLQKYGGIAPAKSQAIRDKARMTMMERYGVGNALMVPEIKKRVFETITERYGGIGFASEELEKKTKQTMMERYGVEFSHQCPEVIEKMRATCLERYGVTNPCLLNPATAAPSSQELIIRSWLDEWGIKYITNDRTIIAPKELDIFIPELNIAIECNGCYWHSDLEKPKRYHIDKFIECRDKNIQLIQIWEDWMVTKQDIVKSFLQAKLGICKKSIYARKCEVQEIDYHTATDFLNKNHIQGRCSSNYRLGLYRGTDLVAVMCFDKRSGVSGGKNSDASEAELIRFCNLRDMRVVGGAGKLLKYYVDKFHPSMITSFSANDISNGQLYKSLGFKSDNTISESYWYIEPITFIRQHRSLYNRRAINKLWPEYDTSDRSWTEKAVMNSKGYLRIYDSGTTKWILKI